MKIKSFKFTSLLIVYSWVVCFVLLPLLFIFVLSFFSSNELSVISLPFSFDGFEILKQIYFYKILWRSVVIATISCVVCFIISYPFSFLIAQSKHKKLLLLLVTLPFWTSSLIRTYALIGLLKTNGLINNFLISNHIISKPLELLFNDTAVVIGLSYNLLPFMILPLYTFFEKMDKSIIIAAKDLNANVFYVFKKIVWPLSIPAVKNSLVLVFFPAMTIFYIPNILGGARSILIGNLIENQFMLLDDWPGGAATSLIVCLLLFMPFLINKLWQAIK